MLFWDGQKPADGTYVTIDIILNLIPPIVFGSTRAFHGLVKRSPTRSVISFLSLFSMFSFITIQIGVCIIAYKYCLMQSWYEPFIFDADKINIPTASHAGTAILTVSMMSYVIAAIIFSPGPPYRKSFYSNKPYCGIIIIELFLVSYLTICPSEAFAQFVNLKPAPFIDYHLVLYALSLGNFIISYIWEVIFTQGFLSEYLGLCLRRLRGPIHKYEKLLEQMQANNKWPPVGHYEISNIGDGYRADERNAVISWHSRWSQWIRSSKLSFMVDLKHLEQESLDQSIPEALSFITIKDEKNQLGEGYSDQDYI